MSDEQEFAAIFRRYHQELYRYCVAIVGNPQDAQDALQNTMVKAMRALPGEERRIELKPWLYRIAHNESVELLRRRRPVVELDPELAAPGSGVAEDAAVRERLRQLIGDLEQLPERQRAALVMRELSGLEYDQIAAALGTSPAVARQTLYEARLSLRQMAEGREMGCQAVTRALSDADGRVTRRRDIRAHLRTCADCRRFRDELAERRADLGAISPLPAVAAAGLLQGLFGGAGGSGAGAGVGAGVTGPVGAGAAKSVGAAAVLKSAATVAVVAAVGVGAADRTGVIDLARVGGGDSQQMQSEGSANVGASAPGSSSTPTTDPDAGGSAAVRQESAPGANSAGTTTPGTQDAPEPGAAQPASSTPGGPATAHPHGRGHEKQHPSAAAHGQQTAASHKAAGKGTGRGGRPDQAASSHPPKPAKPPKPAHAASPDPASKGKAAAPKKAPAGPVAIPPPPSESQPSSPEPKEAPDKGSASAFQP